MYVSYVCAPMIIHVCVIYMCAYAYTCMCHMCVYNYTCMVVCVSMQLELQLGDIGITTVQAVERLGFWARVRV